MCVVVVWWLYVGGHTKTVCGWCDGVMYVWGGALQQRWQQQEQQQFAKGWITWVACSPHWVCCCLTVCRFLQHRGHACLCVAPRHPHTRVGMIPCPPKNLHHDPSHPHTHPHTHPCTHRSITPADLASTPQLLLLASRLLASPPGFACRYKPLLLRLLGPLQHNFNLLTPEQMAEVSCCVVHALLGEGRLGVHSSPLPLTLFSKTQYIHRRPRKNPPPSCLAPQAAEVCAVYRLNITGEWYRWHGAAVLRLGKTFPLAALARVREAYRSQEVPAEQQLQVLLSTVPWRLQRQAEAQEREDRRAAKKEVIGFKQDQRRRQNIADAEKKAAGAAAAAAAARRGKGKGRSSSSSAGGEESIGMGYKGPGGRENWRKRKLKPPGTIGRKF